MMYRLLRNIHLILGMSAALFVLLYAFSAAQMAHRIRLTPRFTEEDVSLPPGLAARPLAVLLHAQRGYGGELGNPQMTPKGFRVTLSRPGTNYAVTYDRSTGQAHIRRESRSFMGELNRLHHQNGLRHSDGALNAWGWALALVSVVLLAIGATGVWMWFHIHSERAMGTLLLSFNLVVSLGLLAMLRIL
jgi:hypothetical protein